MKNEDKIFNLEDTDDLDQETKDQLVRERKITIGFQILSLFEIKKRLTVNEIIVGMKRKNDIIKKRHIYLVHLSQFKKRGILSESNGVWTLSEKK